MYYHNDKNSPIENALRLINDNYEAKVERDGKNDKIQKLFEKGFEVKEPNGPRKISSKMLYQAFWKMLSRMKPLDFIIHGTGRSMNVEKVVTDGVATVMDRGGYATTLRDKNGAFQNLLMYGDAFFMVGTNPKPNTNIPMMFNPISNSSVYFDKYCTGIRSGGWGKSATKAAAIFSFSKSAAYQLFPKLKKKKVTGRVDRTLAYYKETERTYEQTAEAESDDGFVEVCYFYDIAKKQFCVFAGKESEILISAKGENYPFMYNEEPFIPIVQMMCMPSVTGFYNHGIGDMIFDLAVLSRRLMNMEIAHVEDNTYPIELLNVPQGESAKFINRLASAYEMRASGKKAFVPIEYSAGSSNQVSSQTLITQNLTNEWMMLFDKLDNELRRMGINLDDAGHGEAVTATQVLAEEENQNAFIKQVMENNASETKFCVNLTMEMIAEFVSPMDDTPLNLTTMIQADEEGAEPLRMDKITLGQVANELREHNYFCKVNSRSGAIPSNAFKQAQAMRGLQMAQPGSMAQVKLIGQLAELNDIDLRGEDFVAQQQEQQPQNITEEIPEEPQVAQTERIAINSRSGEATPAI